jgi:hypothetical protein
MIPFKIALPIQLGIILAANEAPASGEFLWLQGLERLGSFGLVAFLVWYFVKHALPLQRTDYLEAQRLQREQFFQQSNAARGDFLAALAQTRADSGAQRREDRQSLGEATSAMRDLVRALESDRADKL